MSFTNEEKNYLKKLGANIVSLREEQNIRQKQLADMLDMDDGSLRRIESGRANMRTTTLRKIANALDVEVSRLFDFS